MVVVCVGIHENLNDRDHPEQGNGRDPCCEPQKQQNRDGQLLDHCNARGHGRIEQRHAILVLEQLDGELPRVVLQQSGFEECHADADASR